jgi:hypothetical protein
MEATATERRLSFDSMAVITQLGSSEASPSRETTLSTIMG